MSIQRVFPIISKTLLAGGFLLLAGLQAWAGHSAIDPAPRNEQSWQDRQKQLNQKAAEAGDKAQMIFIGDSITQGWEGSGKEVWATYYAKRNAVNLGIGGDRTQHVLWRLDHGNIEGLQPKAAVVMIGTNNSNSEDNTPGQIVDGVTAIVQKLRQKLPQTKILLVAIFPRGENYNPQRGKILQVNQVLEKLADNQNVFWVDIGYKFVDAEGLIPRDIMPDYLHLTAKGYQIWAESIEPQLSAIIDGKAAATGASEADGEWIWSMEGPNGQMVEGTLILKADGNKLTGKLSRGENRWLEIENGQVNAQQVQWSVKRDRPDGSTMTYEIKGRCENGKITAQVTTTMDSQTVTRDWNARKKDAAPK